jgi:RHS repeat-associated protein
MGLGCRCTPSGWTGAGSATFSYDTNGNLTGDGANTYGYDAENKLLTASTSSGTTLTYDPLGRLFSTASGTYGTTQYLYDGGHVIAEYNGSGALLRRFFWGPGADEPMLQDEGGALNCTGTHFLQQDSQGSVIAASNCSGAFLSANTYDEYGIPGSANWGRYQYTGQAWIPDLGMSFYKTRFYSPTLGRFMQTDPIGYGDGPNWYAYVHNSPVNGTDSTGLAPTDLGADMDERYTGGPDYSGAVGDLSEVVVTGHRTGLGMFAGPTMNTIASNDNINPNAGLGFEVAANDSKPRADPNKPAPCTPSAGKFDPHKTPNNLPPGYKPADVNGQSTVQMQNSKGDLFEGSATFVS